MIIDRIWREQPGKFFFISTKDRSGKWQDHPIKRADVGQLSSLLEDHSDKDLYFCPHGFSKPRRLSKYAEKPKLMWADLDYSDPRKMEGLTPSVAWESSPGRFACLWRLTDTLEDADLNRRLTYHLKADRGGWDLTQVLRVPGTTNYKYESKPKVRLLWMDGPAYSIKDVLKQIPEERKIRDADVARDLYRKYEKKFSGWVRSNLMKGKAQAGKRSEVLWKLTNEIMEAGCTSEEAFELLRVSPWNKFAGRRDGDEQLRREIDKAISRHIRTSDPVEPEETAETVDDDEEYRFLSRSMAEVEEERLDWIWYPYLARGEVTILEGDPGLGKSYLAQMVSKAICDGHALPSVKKLRTVQGKVAYFDIENSAGSVTKRRLLDNGAKRLENFFQEQEPFTIDDDETLDRVYDAIETLRPTLVVFDTLNTYIGQADIHNSAETQQAFKRFIDIARRFGCSVMVLRHLTKSTKERALYRGQGSIAFAGLARVIITVGVHPDDADVRVAAVTKINVARAPKALTFTIEELPARLDAEDRSRFVWGEFVDLTADEVVSAAPAKKDETLSAAVDWLQGVLKDGPLEHRQILRMAEPRSFSEKVLTKAANELKVTRKGTVWSMEMAS